MADTGSRLYGPAAPGTGNGTIFTATAVKTYVRNIHVCNTTASAATFNLAVNGTSATAANCLYYQKSVAAYDSFDWSGFQVLAVTDTLQALQGTSGALTFTISGIESDV